MTVPRAQLEGRARRELLEFYSGVFGWSENPSLSIPNERIFLRAPTDSQYITIRASDAPMSTSGYEHLGILADSLDELQAIHRSAAAMSARLPDVELQPIQEEYGGILLTFRVRFRLPLSLEVQFLRPRALE